MTLDSHLLNLSCSSRDRYGMAYTYDVRSLSLSASSVLLVIRMALSWVGWLAIFCGLHFPKNETCFRFFVRIACYVLYVATTRRKQSAFMFLEIFNNFIKRLWYRSCTAGWQAGRQGSEVRPDRNSTEFNYKIEQQFLRNSEVIIRAERNLLIESTCKTLMHRTKDCISNWWSGKTVFCTISV